ncbi:MAG: succinate dehydrogenase [Flavobacteriaceae bacterium]|nr:MAG: succinate dehydrogenase [Flavobacteriaceae bacterium]
MSSKSITGSSIGRKIAMALSALFLIVFLTQHLIINLTSVISPSLFNEISHFMGTNFLVQFFMQPILLFGVLFHFIMGFILESKNRGARPVKYAYENASANASWVSRNMIYSGLAIGIFLLIHLIDFWVPEISHKYIQCTPEDPNRYFHELHEKFKDLWRVALYCLAFVFLGLHLNHGFASAFQSVGANHSKYNDGLKTFGKVFSILVPALFIVIALFHHFVAA